MKTLIDLCKGASRWLVEKIEATPKHSKETAQMNMRLAQSYKDGRMEVKGAFSWKSKKERVGG